jgi:hypothetical protein
MAHEHAFYSLGLLSQAFMHHRGHAQQIAFVSCVSSVVIIGSNRQRPIKTFFQISGAASSRADLQDVHTLQRA